LEAVVRALQILIASQEKRQPAGVPDGSTAPPTNGVPSSEGAASHLQTLGIGKTKFVRRLVQTKPGISAGEIRMTPGTPGGLTKNFPYKILYALKSNGQIEEREGRYYPIKG